MNDEIVEYQPPKPEFSDTLLTYQVFAGPHVYVRISADPLGPVNKVVTLMAGQRPVRSTLCHIPVGARIEFGHHASGYYEVFAGSGWRGLAGFPDDDHRHSPSRVPGWYVEVNDRTVLTATDAEVQPPIPVTPRVPWHRRTHRALRSATTKQLRIIFNPIAERLGYHHEDYCPGDDW